MECRILTGRRTALLGRNLVHLVLALVLARTASVAKAADDADSARAFIEAGEFAPALDLAKSMDNKAGQRDAVIAQVAQGQAAAGDRRAAIATVAAIDDDRVLSKTLAAVGFQPAVAGPGFGVGPGFGMATGLGFAPGMNAAPGQQNGRPGGQQADFDSLIDLITSTIDQESWTDKGGAGSVMPFQGGVFVDAEGVLRPAMKEDRTGALAQLRRSAAREVGGNFNAHQSAGLRKVSLTRLERQVQLLAAQRKRPTEEMQTLAGLQRIKYVLVYPDDGEILLAGPAGDWQMDGEGRLVGKESNRPVLRLDDLVVVLRHMIASPDARFGCNITPTQASLADVTAYVAETGKSPLKPGQRDTWLKQLREKLGKQEIEVFGIDPRTRAGLVLVEADYRMKLVGMGLEEGVLGVPSYLQMINVPKGQAPPPMDVLRWWFTLNYDAVAATSAHDAFELRGQGVKVLSESELLAANGQQIHTGGSDALNSEFAQNFTKHFTELGVKYPIYAELQNLCDMALVGALLRSENLPDKVRWHMMYFGDPKGYQVPLANAPKTVDTVINHRIVNQTTVIVGVSGGVKIDPNSLVKAAAIKVDNYGALKAERVGAAPKKDDGRARWWWD